MRFGSRSVFKILFLGSLLVLLAGVHAASSRPACPVVLAWDSIPDARVSGYALYYGQTGSPATNRVNVGTARTVTVYNLSSSTSYSFYVVAYDSNGVESSPSNLLPYTPPALSPLQVFKSSDGNAWLQFRAAPGAVGRIEYSPTLNPASWRSLSNSAAADTNGYLVFVDSSSFIQRFYRAVLP